MPTTQYAVTGMTCSHCERSVTEQVSRVAGVTQVDVDVARGRLTVTGTDAVEPDAVVEAVDAAGYEAQPAR